LLKAKSINVVTEYRTERSLDLQNSINMSTVYPQTVSDSHPDLGKLPFPMNHALLIILSMLFLKMTMLVIHTQS